MWDFAIRSAWFRSWIDCIVGVFVLMMKKIPWTTRLILDVCRWIVWAIICGLNVSYLKPTAWRLSFGWPSSTRALYLRHRVERETQEYVSLLDTCIFPIWPIYFERTTRFGRINTMGERVQNVLSLYVGWDSPSAVDSTWRSQTLYQWKKLQLVNIAPILYPSYVLGTCLVPFEQTPINS